MRFRGTKTRGAKSTPPPPSNGEVPSGLQDDRARQRERQRERAERGNVREKSIRDRVANRPNARLFLVRHRSRISRIYPIPKRGAASGDRVEGVAVRGTKSEVFFACLERR